jgi:hypothetical protein
VCVQGFNAKCIQRIFYNFAVLAGNPEGECLCLLEQPSDAERLMVMQCSGITNSYARCTAAMDMKPIDPSDVVDRLIATRRQTIMRIGSDFIECIYLEHMHNAHDKAPTPITKEVIDRFLVDHGVDIRKELPLSKNGLLLDGCNHHGCMHFFKKLGEPSVNMHNPGLLCASMQLHDHLSTLKVVPSMHTASLAAGTPQERVEALTAGAFLLSDNIAEKLAGFSGKTKKAPNSKEKNMDKIALNVAYSSHGNSEWACDFLEEIAESYAFDEQHYKEITEPAIKQRLLLEDAVDKFDWMIVPELQA